ncbi:MAG TPA: hypothetical protein VHV10_00310, partial [Ktedonobacteraceae bacterium]|nr:hypothetical protein [Ktedonobacteraceae bacterium]
PIDDKRSALKYDEIFTHGHKISDPSKRVSYLPILPQRKEKTDYNDGELSGVMPAVVMVGLVRAGSDQTGLVQVTLIATGAGQISWSLPWDQVC